MARHFSSHSPSIGAVLPRNSFGLLTADFQFASHIPLRGGANTGRHIYLSLKVPGGPFAGVFEAAVNIRSDAGTEVLYAQRIENLDAGVLPEPGFQDGVSFSYGSGGSSDPDFMALKDADFHQIVNDDLYNRISDLSQGCDRVGVHGVTYSGGDGIHDVHMNSGTRPGGPHSGDDRDHQDGAVAFYFDQQAGGDRKTFAIWVFIKFDNQSVVDV